MEKESWRMNHGGGVIEEESWRGNLGSVIMEASRRHLETARSLPEAPTWHSESPRRHPGGTHLRFSPLSRLSKSLINKLSNNNYKSNSNRLLVIIAPP